MTVLSFAKSESTSFYPLMLLSGPVAGTWLLIKTRQPSSGKLMALNRGAPEPSTSHSRTFVCGLEISFMMSQDSVRNLYFSTGLEISLQIKDWQLWAFPVQVLIATQDPQDRIQGWLAVLRRSGERITKTGFRGDWQDWADLEKAHMICSPLSFCLGCGPWNSHSSHFLLASAFSILTCLRMSHTSFASQWLLHSLWFCDTQIMKFWHPHLRL